MSSPFNSGENPYTSPSHTGATHRRESRRLPGFCKAVFILDLCFCVIRVGLVLLGLVGYVTLKRQEPTSPLLPSVTMELLTGLAIAATGIPASIAMLARQSWGAILAWMCVLATVASFGVGVWQLWLTIDAQAAPGTPQRIGFLIGGGLVAMIRLALVLLYVAAVVRFSAWARALEASSSSSR